MTIEAIELENPWTAAGLELTCEELADHAEMTGAGDAWEGKVIPFPVPQPVKHGDATVIGDLTAPDCDVLLKQRTVVGLTDRAPRVNGSKWARLECTWADVVNMLSSHPERVDKGGNALFFADADKTGKINGQQRMAKRKKSIRTIYAVAIDVDGGTTAEAMIARIRQKGLFAVVYTTHSNVAKGGPGSDRFRVILPLSVPFELGPNGDDGKARYADWEARYVGLAETLTPEGGKWDFTATRPSQLMYAPARPHGAAFKHYIIAGKGLDLSTISPSDPSRYRNTGPTGVSQGSGSYDGEPAFLSDGFDLLAWHGDHGEYFELHTFLEEIGWEVLDDAGKGFDIVCPHGGHSAGTGETAWAMDGLAADSGALIYCHHDHCRNLRTCDFLRLLEEHAALSDGHETLSSLLCDPIFYPSAIDGEPVEVNWGDYIEAEIKIGWLKTPAAVKRAFKALSDKAGEDHLAAIFGGICKAGTRADAVATWDKLAKDRLDANARKRVEKRGRDMVEDERKAFAAGQAEERHKEREEALDRTDLAHVSMDPAEPLGDDMAAALATLGKRFAPVDLDGKFRIVRKPDLEAFKSETDSTIAVYRKDDFLDLHLDRPVMEGDDLVNPARVFLTTAKRKSGLVFAPPPCVAGPNDFNMYQGRKLTAKAGSWDTLRDFIFRVICRERQAEYDWLMLWMAHLVQRPGDKAGTAVICRGEGGTGKGTFGAVLAKLAAPHFKQLEKEAHVIGQFAGEHLSKCVLAVVNEAVFGASPKVSSELKALVDSHTMQVEAKGLNVVTVPSFIRLYIDSNDALPVLIEGNGSERRYFVLEVSTAEKQRLDYFAKVRAAIEGDEMRGLLAYLESYDPANAGLHWDAVRTAPETPERALMGWHSMPAPMRRLADVLKDGEVTLRVSGEEYTFTADAEGLKVPVAAFRDYVAAVGNRHRAADGDVPAMFDKLFPGVVLKEGKSTIGPMENGRWWQFPPEVSYHPA